LKGETSADNIGGPLYRSVSILYSCKTTLLKEEQQF